MTFNSAAEKAAFLRGDVVPEVEAPEPHSTVTKLDPAKRRKKAKDVTVQVEMPPLFGDSSLTPKG